MTHQILKGLGATSLVAVLAVLSVPAEAATIRCKIPFSFIVNEKTLPAGTYTVSTECAQGVLRAGLRPLRGGLEPRARVANRHSGEARFSQVRRPVHPAAGRDGRRKRAPAARGSAGA